MLARVSLRARVAFASGVAGSVGAVLLLAGRFEGTVVLAFAFAWAARLAPAATMMGAGPILAGGAARALWNQLCFAPAWALIVGIGALRAGSVELVDVRGANAVAGLALARGPVLTVLGVWCALAAGAAAVGSSTPMGAETAAPQNARGVVAVPPPLRRLEAAGALAQIALLVTLFAGPQIDAPADTVWWITGAVALAVGAIVVRTLGARFAAPAVSGAAAAIGLALVLLGGAP
jgi:hypothetical protein